MSDTSCSDPGLDADMSELPTGTVTLLLADVEGSTRLWETQPEVMRTAIERLDQTLAAVVADHRGVRPVEQGEGDSFVIAFARAGDAVSCAVDLQRSPLAPIKLRIGIHTGDVTLRDEGNYIGPTVNRTARLRDLAHGGQTVLSGATEPLVVEQLPPDASLVDLGTHPLRDLPRPERVVQLCHADLHNDFPPLRSSKNVAAERLPTQLTSFIGREKEMAGIRDALTGNRLVTLTGAGGAGKTRLAVQIAAAIADAFADGVAFVDLAPITDPELVPVTAARALGLPDQPGQPTLEVLRRFVRDRRMLIVLDNCEHLLDASEILITAVLAASPGLTLLATSREPVGMAGEVSWRVPSLSLADEAVELFSDRARRTKPEFRLTADNAAIVTDICRRLDGLPLAIELAAARIRALTPAEILASLHDQFRLLTGGARNAVRRQQTLRASVDWSHALLSDSEQVLFRRLAVFVGGCDLDAAQAVVGNEEMERFQVLDQLTLLVDKSLVVADEGRRGTRYRMLETVRQYAQEKLGESREGDAVRTRHRDHYAAAAARLDAEWAETEMDNVRAAFAWSREIGDVDTALNVASSLQLLWLTRGRIQEGLDWLTSALDDGGAQAAPRVRASAIKALLLSFMGTNQNNDEVVRTLAMARDLDDPSLVMLALTAAGMCFAHDPEAAQRYFGEAADLATELGDARALGQIRAQEALAAFIGDGPAEDMRAAAEEGLRIAETIGDSFGSRQCRFALGWVQMLCSDMAGSARRYAELAEDSQAAHDPMFSMYALVMKTFALAYLGDIDGGRKSATDAMRHAAELFEYYEGPVHTARAIVEIAAGDAGTAWEEYETAMRLTGLDPRIASTYNWAPLPPLACGDIAAARRWADEVVDATRGCGQALALAGRARVKIAQQEWDGAEQDAHEVLETARRLGVHMMVPFALDCLAMVAVEAGTCAVAARLFGAAESARALMGVVRFAILRDEDDAFSNAAREALGQDDFDAAWAEGAALSIDEAVAYARRGRGQHRRASSGWASLTRAELDVARLVSEGLGNKDIAARLFISPRTVQAHLTHVYAKLSLTSRVQLAQEVAQHS